LVAFVAGYSGGSVADLHGIPFSPLQIKFVRKALQEHDESIAFSSFCIRKIVQTLTPVKLMLAIRRVISSGNGRRRNLTIVSGQAGQMGGHKGGYPPLCR
jgi:hypothetical protein